MMLRGTRIRFDFDWPGWGDHAPKILGAGVLLTFITRSGGPVVIAGLFAAGILVARSIVMVETRSTEERLIDFASGLDRRRPAPLGIQVGDGRGASGREVPSCAEAGQRAANALLVEVENGGAFVRDLFVTALPQMRGLRDKHLALGKKLVEIRRFITAQDPSRVARERERMADMAARTHDATARVGYLAALASLDACLATQADMIRDAERIEARMKSIEAAFEAARAQVARVRTAQARGEASDGTTLVASLTRLSDEVGAVADAADEAFSHEGIVRDAPMPRGLSDPRGSAMEGLRPPAARVRRRA